jgi:hypothetical protein
MYLGDSTHYYNLEWTNETGSGGGSSMIAANWASRPAVNTDHTWLVRKRPGNHFQLYFDGALVGTVQSDYKAQSSSTYFGYYASLSSGAQIYFRTSGLSVPVSNDGVGTWESSAFDSTVTPSAWAPCLYSYTQTGSDALEVLTASSPDNATYDSYVPLSGNEVQSTLRRYLKVKITISLAHESAGDTTVQDVTFGSTTSSTHILMPVMTGKNIYDAISSMARFANYEFGFYPDETFFFRPRVFDGPPSMTLDASMIERISSYSEGWDKVYSIIKATYGVYTKEKVSAGGTYDDPMERFSSRLFQISADSAYQISPNADVATGVANQFYEMLSVPRRRFKINTKLFPQIDLGDIVQVNYRDDLSEKCRVVGIRYDLEGWTAETDLVAMDASAATAPSAPTDIEDLAAWWSADSGIYQDTAKTTPADENNDPVGVIVERTASGKDFQRLYNDSYRATFKTNVLNGFPAVEFDGSDDWMETLGGSFAITGGCTIFFVCALLTEQYVSQTYNPFIGGYDGGCLVRQVVSDHIRACGNGSFDNYIDVADTYSASPILWCLKLNGAASVLYKNKSVYGTGNAGATNITLFELGAGIHSEQFGAQPTNVRFFEQIVYDRALTDLEIAQVHNYLHVKYGL